MWWMVDEIVAVSEDARTELLKHNAVRPERVKVILNGIGLDRTPQDGDAGARLRREFDIPADARVIATVGRLAEEKDHASLLRAFRRVIDRGVPAHLLIVGGGELELQLKQMRRTLGLETAVTFAGFRRDVPDLLNGIDLFVLSSKMEGISLTLLEAMAAGKPIVATKVGGNEEVVADGRTGLLVPPEAPAALADAILAMLLEPRTAEAVGRRGLARVRELFSVERMAEEYLALYRSTRNAV
jgi:glycosyltransferase involved in cell wall biosynthesis